MQLRDVSGHMDLQDFETTSIRALREPDRQRTGDVASVAPRVQSLRRTDQCQWQEIAEGFPKVPIHGPPLRAPGPMDAARWTVWPEASAACA